MKDEQYKTILRIIQDYCFENSASILCDKFSISIASKIIKLINNKEFTVKNFLLVAKSRRDYFVANDLNIKVFCKNLYKKINYELQFAKDEMFYDTMLRFKGKFEDNIIKNVKVDSNLEDWLRRNIALLIDDETFLEAEMSGGKSDICVPTEKIIIETKLWNGEKYYQSGFTELDSYLSGRRYNEGYYVNFDYTKNGCEHMKINNGVFDITFNNKLIHVIFIKMNPFAPSKKSKLEKVQNN